MNPSQTELEVLRLRLDQLERAERLRALRVKRGFAAAVVVALAVGGLASKAWAATCAQTLPAGLVTFCPDDPAQAAQVNSNFQQLVDWAQQKTGPVGSSDITSNASLTFGGARVGQHINLNGGLYGIGIQSSTQYYRTGGGFAWFINGAHAAAQNDPGAGGTLQASLDSSGNFASRGNLNAGAELQGNRMRRRSCTWEDTGRGIGADDVTHQAICPTGQFAAGWRCRATTYLDGDCAVYCCLP